MQFYKEGGINTDYSGVRRSLQPFKNIISRYINTLALELIDTIYDLFSLSSFRLQLHISFILTSSRKPSLQIVVVVPIQRVVRNH